MRHRFGPISLVSALNASLYLLQVTGPLGEVDAAAAAEATAVSSGVTSPASNLPPNLGEAATSFDVDADWVRVRLGLDDDNSDVRKRGNGRHGKNAKKWRRKRKGGGPHFRLELPKIPELQLPELPFPQVRFDFRDINDAIGKIYNRGQRRGGTHIRHVADMFDMVLKKRSSSDTEIDSIALLEACRIFLPVMKTFGPDAAAKDFARNLKKADKLRKHSGKIGAGKMKGGIGTSRKKKERRTKHHQSLRDLLMAEVEAGIHKPGGILKDPSGAVGFLWMRRSIAYQHALFQALCFGTEPKEAAFSAYRSTLMPFHGWAMRRLYTAFLGQCTPKTTKGGYAIGYSMISRIYSN